MRIRAQFEVEIEVPGLITQEDIKKLNHQITTGLSTAVQFQFPDAEVVVASNSEMVGKPVRPIDETVIPDVLKELQNVTEQRDLLKDVTWDVYKKLHKWYTHDAPKGMR